MILLIDNYDSFTYNLAHLIGATGRKISVVRNDKISTDEALATKPEAIVLSPGPGIPDNAGICLDVIKGAASAGVPVFGVCLGMQAIAQAFGGTIIRAEMLMHGKTSAVRHTGETTLFDNIPTPFQATRYHSLVAEPDKLPGELTITASSVSDDEIMAVEHKDMPIAGVQFHPESIATDHGAQLMENFLRRADAS
ncbi:MAG: aminodeoxychorismate/anthranilate synthase component II [Pseudomonadota bacterium]